MRQVALVIAVVVETRGKLAEVGFPEWLAAHRAESFMPKRPAVHPKEFHMPPPNEKQNTVSVV